MEEENKVVIKLHKELLESERQELKEKKRKRRLTALLCYLMLALGVVIGFVIASVFGGRNIAFFKKDKLDKIVSYFDAVWLYKNDYEDLEGEMEDKAFYGMTNFAGDPYTTYMSADEIKSFAESINMNYVGIGAQYSFTNGVGTVTRVFIDSPADKGGLLPGDVFYKADGISLEGLSSDEIRQLIQGPEGTSVNVTVLRSGKEIDLTFVRSALDYTCYGEAHGDYLYLNIMSFGETTGKECASFLDKYKDYHKLILDLRDNTGGYQTAVQEVGGLFIGKDEVVLNETDNKGVTKSFKATSDTYYDNLDKIVIITNDSTASAAEVLTIAIKEKHKDAIQVGTTTYGKGVVQSSFYLDDGSALKLTTSYWTSPNGVSINNVGVVPEYEVKLDDILYETTYAMEEDVKYALDSVSVYIQIAEQGLKFLDYNIDRDDGYFNSTFETALNKFKADNDLAIDSILDANTYNAIISSVIREYHTNTNKDAQLVKAVELIES